MISLDKYLTYYMYKSYTMESLKPSSARKLSLVIKNEERQ